ncbi:acetyl-CoA carboxylase biotin carboxyl carrier protein [Lacisediminimonas sp.]|uniref:acetyl-CoA carboxylase biotin carboxyl carrier protein n=1 Tax=Lacisediminimonas sp. TaxID=3060582 RepID=UPI002716EE36|nr:acetyl-CoA carboxylase biotin carboxyl carrier protein [Lacisediminimonas sp.]MDO8298883.1 acetyl-CoA carboxylase biotin carboxyl carrier protein [Lacisediminimonas sp.]
MNPTIDDVREVLKIFLDSDLQDLKLEIGSVRLAVSKNGSGAMQPFSPQIAMAPAPVAALAAAPAAPSATAAPAPAAAPAASAVAANWVAITAPSVGVFYSRPSPDKPPFVQVGSTVQANDPVCLVEVMKLFTGVHAPVAGRIVQIAVADSTMVEYGQPLMYIEPA